MAIIDNPLMNEYIIRSEATMRDIMLLIWEKVKIGLQSGPVVILLGRLSKSREQEEKYHAMIGDIAKTIELYGKYHKPPIWKALLVDQFQEDKINMQSPLTHPGSVVISLDGRRAVSVRASTKQFRKFEASEFIEFLYAWGSEHGAKFSEKSLAIYQEYKEANK